MNYGIYIYIYTIIHCLQTTLIQLSYLLVKFLSIWRRWKAELSLHSFKSKFKHAKYIVYSMILILQCFNSREYKSITYLDLCYFYFILNSIENILRYKIILIFKCNRKKKLNKWSINWNLCISIIELTDFSSFMSTYF